jgi:hypothetical protein
VFWFVHEQADNKGDGSAPGKVSLFNTMSLDLGFVSYNLVVSQMSITLSGFIGRRGCYYQAGMRKSTDTMARLSP